MNEKYFNILLSLSLKAYKKNEVPVAALITKNDKIISTSYNKREKSHNVLSHAEINCIIKASKKLKRWNLSDCCLYVSLKPCDMCTEIIKQTKIKKVYYLLDKPSFKHEYNKTIFSKIDNSNFTESYQQILSNFFKNKRS